MKRSAALGSGFVLHLACAACSAPATIDRVDHGRIWAGRSVSPEAYAWYARGLRLEREGKLGDAASAFKEAVRADPKSGSAWGALGRIHCKAAPELAFEIWARGLEDAEERLPILLARGDCHLKRHEPAQTQLDAIAAVALVPDSVEASQLLETSFRQLGQGERGQAVGLALKQFQSARRSGFNVWPELEASEPTVAELDAAIDAGDLEQARRRAAGLVTPGALALRALARGRPELARSQAELVLTVDPDEVDAGLALWLGRRSPAVAMGEPQRSADAPEEPTAPPAGPPSTLGVLLFAEYLGRTVGHDAARLFLTSAGELGPLDELETTLAGRLAIGNGATGNGAAGNGATRLEF